MGLVQRLAYGLLFCGVLPLLLVLLASSTEPWVRLPLPEGARWQGALLGAAGVVVMAWGMCDLVRRGGGLPMNAFPPKRLVRTGVYRWLGQPIYTGAVVLCAGLSIVFGSRSGLWLVTPLLALACWALTFGYERQDLRRRFGELAVPLLSVPPAGAEPASGLRRLAALAFVLTPWLVLFTAVTALPPAPDSVDAYFSFERRWPIVPWTEVLYGSAYLAVPLALLRPQSNGELRNFVVGGLLATLLVGLLWFTVPLVAPPRPLGGVGDSLMLGILELERSLDDPVGNGAFPSFHVTWTLLCAAGFGRSSRGVRAALVWAWALAVCASCVTTGMHALIDVVGGGAVFLLVHHRGVVWAGVLRGSERLANGWREWHFGPIRVINHGVFGFLGASAGCLVVMGILGSDRWVDMWVVGLSSVVTAGLWAQIIEGESVSLRPFGYYGAVVGMVLGGIGLTLFGRSAMEPWAAFAVGSPLIQALGRCRCLIQGCCHGQPCRRDQGIVVVHPRSRVVRLAGFGGRAVWPTQTYSILANLVSTLVMFRLWSVGVPAPVLVGAYLVLAGAGRFVEEAYRGEPQTPRVGGMAVYQWNAVISFVVGVGFLGWPGERLSVAPGLDAVGVGSALGLGLIVGVVMGADVPGSRRRFGRLTK